jgi:hypothetical protein
MDHGLHVADAGDFFDLGCRVELRAAGYSVVEGTASANDFLDER